MRRLFAALCLLLGACTQAQWNDSLATQEDRALAQRAIAALRAGDAATLRQLMEPALYAQTEPQMDAARAILGAAGTPELVTTGSDSVSDAAGTHTTTCQFYEYGADKRWVYVQLCLADPGQPQRVNGWHATPYDQRPSAIGDFRFAGKGALHYLWLALMAAAAATCVTAFVLAIRGKGIKRRWLWAIGSLLGFGQFTLDWTSGDWSITPVYMMLLAAGASRPFSLEGWQLSFALPIVAIIFLARRRALLAGRDQAAGPAAPPPGTD